MKGVAIQTILILLVGILVVGIIMYTVYRYTNKSSSSFGEQECKTVISSWCTLCYNYDPGFKTPGGPLQTDELWQCVDKYFYSSYFIDDRYRDPDMQCHGNNVYCKNFIPYT